MADFMIEESTQEDLDFIDDQMDVYNESQVPYTQSAWAIDINRTMKDADGNIIAVLKSYIYGWKCLYLELFWVKKECRLQGCGSALLAEVERTAIEAGSHLVHLDTFDFQAKDFYLKKGYEVFGVLDDCPPGHKRYYLKKRLYNPGR